MQLLQLCSLYPQTFNESWKQAQHQYRELCIYGDTALAYPKSDGVTVSPVVQACTISRLSENKQFEANEIAQAEKIIARAQGQELETIKTLCTLFRQSAQRHGIAKHCYLWYSLILDQR